MSALAWAAGRAPEYDVVIEPDRRMPLRDGTQLAMDLYYPARDGKKVEEPLPVVLWRTPYDKIASTGPIARYFASHGYIGVSQDVRGRYASEGVFYPFAHEGPDGYDTVEWIAAQPWCNGKVGTTGASYFAAVQNALACHNPPHLSAMIPIFGPSSYFHSAMRHNGALEMRFFRYAFSMASESREAAADPVIKAALLEAMTNIWDWVKAFPIRRGETPLRLIPSYEEWAIDISTRVLYDDYWRQSGYGPAPCFDTCADVPTLYIGGWYDSYTRSTVENFLALHPRQKQPVHLLMGPWKHSLGAEGEVGDLSFAPHGGLPDAFQGVQLHWFDHWLKGIDNGIDRQPPVRYFEMGGGAGTVGRERLIQHGGRWRTSPSWPPPHAKPMTCYLHGDGGLRTTPPSAESDSTSYTYDPANPVPTIGGNLSALGVEPGGYDQRADARFPFCQGSMPLSARQDVLCFISEPLTEELVLTGPIEARLWVATDGRDTDFTAKLMDLYPPSPAYPAGAAINLTDSIQRLRFRHGYEREELVEPGEICEISFQLYPTANRFAVGHRLRVDISSSNFPRFDLNPNTGGVLGADRCRRIATNTLYHDAGHPSHLLLSILS